jgi:dihydroflavonol-4-reductase
VENKLRVLVTGGTGFIGSWLIRRLVNDGYDVSVLVRKNSDLSELTGLNCKFVYGDVTDLSSLQKSFVDIDTVFHLAGYIAYRKIDREKMNAVNIHGTENVINAVKSCSVKKLVYLSSVVAIGAGFNSSQILNENSPYNVHELNLGYFETKHAAEKLVVNAVKNKEIWAVILNPSTVYGAGDARKESRGTQLKVAQGRFKFYTSGGVNVVAIEDVIDGIISAWKVGTSGERYILSGENLSIKDLFLSIANCAGVKAPQLRIPNFVLFILGLIGDILNSLGFSSSLSLEKYYTSTMYHWFDNSKAKQKLGFNPRPAREAIAASVKWSKEKGLI